MNAPTHLAIVMDGNGRWASAQGLERCAGHSAGVTAIRRVTEAAARLGIPYLSLFAFSRENWSRDDAEIAHLFGLLEFYLARETRNLVEQGIRLRVIGWREGLAPSVQAAIEDAERATSGGTRMQLVIAVNFSGRWEITRAIESIVRAAPTGPITEELVAAHLPDGDIPPPDLFVRTAGERRISNYFLWNLAYTELHFTDVCWPDFGDAELREALDSFAARRRSFGGVPSLQARNIGGACPLTATAPAQASRPPRRTLPTV